MIGRSLIILAMTTLGATAVVAQSNIVTVYRGSDSHTVRIDSQGYALAPNVRIERVPQVPVTTVTQTNTRVQATDVSNPVSQLAAGQTIWLTDESNGGLIACRLVWTGALQVKLRRGHWVIRCYNGNGGVARPGIISPRSRLRRDVLLGRIQPSYVSSR